jgi:hypothetical protein
MSRMMIVLKELTTPFGMAAAKTEMNTRIALGSVRATVSWSLLKALFLMPVSLPATRLTAIKRSRCVRKRAFAGESGRKT